MSRNIEELSINTIRSLCIDIINKAKSGHPGTPLGAAPIMYVLFTKHFIANPKEPNWFNRDRFVLSAGHASSLLYSTLHLCEYSISLDDLKNFRQLGSITPGHPEYGITPGIDATAGPLGQGIAEAVGMAVAEIMVSKNYPSGKILCDHYTYCLVGDGCLEEGISQEAIAFAGHNKLNKLIVFYDRNNITLDGSISLSDNTDTRMRFEAVGWDVVDGIDGNDINAIDNAIKYAKKSKDKPTLIIVDSVIGYGSSFEGTNKVHGNPLGESDGNHAKKDIYKFDHPEFFVPEEVASHFRDTFVYRGQKAFEQYQKEFVNYSNSHKTEAKRFLDLINENIDGYIPRVLPQFELNEEATRKSSGAALNALALCIPNLVGGAADVASSVMTSVKNEIMFTPESRNGHTINFGIREFAMSAIQNGILLHGGLKTYIGCFFVFADYMKAGIRMSALTNVPAIYIFTHDSIAVGEDGPTHQPIEQLAMLRSIPNVSVIRPADARETFKAWQLAILSKNKPVCLILSRQNLPLLQSKEDGVERGGYIISKNSKSTHMLVATGSEVSLSIEVQRILAKENINVDVVSLPSWDIFDSQSEEYKNSVLHLPKSKRISVEMLSSFGWDKYADYHISIDTFGASGKPKDVLKHFGFDVESVANKIREIVK